MASLPNDMQRISEHVGRLASSDPTLSASPKTVSRQLVRAVLDGVTTASVLANGSDAINPNASSAVYVPRKARVIEVKFLPKGNATANASNYATGKLYRLHGNGAVGNVIATFDTRPTANGGVGNVAIATTVSATIDAAEESVAAGVWLAPVVAQVSSGVAFPAGSWSIAVEWEGVDTVPV